LHTTTRRYAAADGGGIAHALASLLGRHANVWLDTYRLENAVGRHQSVHAAAAAAAFVVLIVTPELVASVEGCLGVLEALRRPAEQVLVWIDVRGAWEGGTLERVRGYLRGRRLRVVAESVESLVKGLDEVLMSEEAWHAEWWRGQRLVEDTTLQGASPPLEPNHPTYSHTVGSRARPPEIPCSTP
jgi:hypothetical protein